MSILIKGMEMPGTGRYLIVYPDGRVVDTDIDGESQCIIPGSKAIPVPDHGRLIDADALIEDLERQCKAVFRIDAVSPDDYWITRNEAYNEALWKTWVESFGKYLKTRLTIIPAEGGE